MNNPIQISGLDKNYLNSDKGGKDSKLLIISNQVTEKQRCGCCDECQCEKHVGDQSFVCPCRTSDGGCCC